eukprot:GFKZ01006783.1.p1 GENE.GFKZ01006783.1~~GFKZ01006783.1.p1  ORF type:complete len:937 (+),score=174.89 GFKZ01006783.1:196-3006(+)
MPTYDIPALQRAIENVENNDAEAHKLYNNLGLAHFANRRYRQSLKAHREEKRACKRLVASSYPPKPAHQLDLAIAYRRCGDTMLKLDKLVDARQVVIDERANVIRAANEQHRKGLEIVRNVKGGGIAARVELQAACAAVAQSALALSLETRDRGHFEAAAFCCVEAAVIAESLPMGDAGVKPREKEAMLLGISTNMAIAVSGLGHRDKAKTLLEAVAVRAKKSNDDFNLVRAVANLAEEASEEEDWDTSEAYVREWIRLAKKNEDQDDEADALRKLGVVLNEKQMYEEARGALEKALIMSMTKHGQEEARRFLSVVEQQIEDQRAARRELDELEEEGASLQRDNDVIQEAKARMRAGNVAFKLQKMDDAVRLLRRYFELVDEYGCDPVATGIDQAIHNNAVANMGEAMWTLKKYGEAVKWASRELTLFTEDMAGQAQAWCNLGVYLDDFGKREKAIEALRTSIELAEKSEQCGILERARINLDLVIKAEAERKAQEANVLDTTARLEDNSMDDVIEMEHSQSATRDEGRDSNARKNNTSSRSVATMGRSTSGNAPASGERSIIIDSSQPMKNIAMRRAMGSASEMSQGISSRRSRRERTNNTRAGAALGNKIPGQEQSRSYLSRGIATADGSSAAVNKFVDLVAEYKAKCTKRRHPPVPTRAMVITALRSLSSVLLAREACDEPTQEPAKLDVSALFLNNYDVSVLFETLSGLGNEHCVALNMKLNPMVTPAAYECLNPNSFTAPSALYSLRSLDFSCAGVSGSALRTISDALSRDGSLMNVTSLNISKNGLGKQCRATATSVARILHISAQLEILDLSLNLLPERFMGDLLDAVVSTGEQLGDADLAKSPVRRIDMHLNNRKAPTALLEVEDPSRIVGCFRKLFSLMPGLESVDVRACGGNSEMRKALRELANGLGSLSQNIITVSPDIHDDLSG